MLQDNRKSEKEGKRRGESMTGAKELENVKRIMIVDDEREIANLTKEILSCEPYEIETVNSGEECLKRMKEFKPDLILLDIMMPNMDGWEVFEELEKRDMLENTKVALFTVKNVSEEDRRRRELVLHYIQKPFYVRYLLKEITKIFEEEN